MKSISSAALTPGDDQLAGAVVLLQVDGEAEVDVLRGGPRPACRRPRRTRRSARASPSATCTIAHAMTWVNEILPPRLRVRWLLMTVRLSMSSFAGTARTLVAVGTAERRLHVGDDPRGRTAQDLVSDPGGRAAGAAALGRCGGRGAGAGTTGRRSGCRGDAHRGRVGWRGGHRGGGGGRLGRPVVLEEPVPGRVDGGGVGQVLLVQLVDEPLVGPELVGTVLVRRGGHRRVPRIVAADEDQPSPARSAYGRAAAGRSGDVRRSVAAAPAAARMTA